MPVKVFILTRFAIRPEGELVDFSRVTNEPEKFLSDDWLVSRLKYLQKITLPSLQAQSYSDFVWIVGLAQVVPQEHQQRLAEIVGGVGELLLVPEGGSFVESVERRLSSEHPTVDKISIRLDSDDAIHPRFIEKAVRVSRRFQMTSFTHGAQINLAAKTAFHRFSKSNSFLVYRSTFNRHVLSFGLHSTVSRFVRVNEVLTVAPFYLRVNHGDNASIYQDLGIPILSTRRLRRVYQFPTRLEFGTWGKAKMVLHYLSANFGKKIPLVMHVYRLFQRLSKAR